MNPKQQEELMRLVKNLNVALGEVKKENSMLKNLNFELQNQLKIVENNAKITLKNKLSVEDELLSEIDEMAIDKNVKDEDNNLILEIENDLASEQVIKKEDENIKLELISVLKKEQQEYMNKLEKTILKKEKTRLFDVVLLIVVVLFVAVQIYGRM